MTMFALGLLVLLLFALFVHSVVFKKVVLVVNGEERTVTTRHSEIHKLLEEEAVAVDAHDRISMPGRGYLADGDRIEIEHTLPVTVIHEGRQNVVHTVSGTVRELLGELGIALDDDDRTEPDLDWKLNPGDRVKVIRVDRVVEQVGKELPYAVVRKEDPALARGKEKVVSEGKPGLLVETVERIYEDGILTSSRVLDTKLAQASVDEVVAVGTRRPVTVLSASSPNIQEVTKSGITFGVKQILTDVVLTAYHAGYESTGKTEEHPQYGITFSGTKVQEGRTVAVDPSVIPLGWWVYIEGYGFRRAEDKGSGVKGKHIDIYFEDGDYAREFGKKRGYTVYIIGPKKPEASGE